MIISKIDIIKKELLNSKSKKRHKLHLKRHKQLLTIDKSQELKNLHNWSISIGNLNKDIKVIIDINEINKQKHIEYLTKIHKLNKI